MLSEEEKKEYEQFVESNNKGHYTQSLHWAEMKKEWESEVVIVRDEKNAIKGTMLLLIKKIPFFNSSLVYSPRGPVCDIHDEKTIGELLKKAEEIAKKHKAFMLKIDPDIPNKDMEFKKIVKNNGFKVIEKAKDINRELQSRIVFRLNLKDKSEDEVMKGFHSKTRYNVKLAMKKGVTIRDGKKEDLDEFLRIMDVTSKRDGFPVRNKEFFERFYDAFGPEHVRIIFADYEGKSLACVFDVMYGDKVWYRYGGSLNENRNLMPTYLLQWEGIKWGIENKCNVYDFSGVNAVNDDTRNDGLYRFKSGFGPELIEFTEIYKVYNHFIYLIYEKFFTLYRKIRVALMKKNK